MSGRAVQGKINKRAKPAAMARVGLSNPGEVDETTEAFWSSTWTAPKDSIISILCLYPLVFALGIMPTEGTEKGIYEVAGIGALLLVIVTAVPKTIMDKTGTFAASKTAVPGACVGGDMDAGGLQVSVLVCKTTDGTSRPLCIIRRSAHNSIDAHGNLQPMTSENRQEFSGIIEGVVAHASPCVALECRSLKGAVISRSEDSRCKWQAQRYHTRAAIILAGIKSCCTPGVHAAATYCLRAGLKLLVLGVVGFDMIGSADARDQLTEIQCKQMKGSEVWETGTGVVVKAAVAISLGVIAGCAVGEWTMPFPFTVRDVERGLASGPPVFMRGDPVVALPPKIFE